MKNYKLIWLGIFCCLQPLILFAQRGETIRKAFLDPKSDQVLVVAHRGNWRSAPENSVAAIDSAIQWEWILWRLIFTRLKTDN